MALVSTPTTRWNWSDPQAAADITKIRMVHIQELRAASDDMDERLDYHIGYGGIDRHPIVTDTVAGFMSPEQKKYLDDWAKHDGPNGTIININPSDDPSAAVNNETLKMVQDSYAIRTGRYSFSTSQGNFTHTIDLTSWSKQWDQLWQSKYPTKPNPGFQCVLIPAITGIRTGKSATWYDYLVERIDSIQRVSDVVFNVQVSVSGSTKAGHIDTYGCQGWTNFTFTVLGASKNMFADMGNISGTI